MAKGPESDDLPGGRPHWDDVLLQNLPAVETASSDEDFNSALTTLIEAAGPMANLITVLPTIPDSLKFNLDLSWINDPVFSTDVRALLDTVRVRFRPISLFVHDSLVPGTIHVSV